MEVGVVVDSRNMYHQVGDVCGVRSLPSVVGIRAALARLGMTARSVHVGLALPRTRDLATLTDQDTENRAYMQEVVVQGGDVLLGELHRKQNGVEEKMVDVACAVRVTQHVEQIRAGQSDLAGVVVLSKDSDLWPAYDHAIRAGVKILVASTDVVQHRRHPFLLLGPHALAEFCPKIGLTTGHEIRASLAIALDREQALSWEVRSGSPTTLMHRQSGMLGIATSRVRLPPVGQTIVLYPVGVMWRDSLLGSFPILRLAPKKARRHTWSSATVRFRPAPQSVRLALPGQGPSAAYPMGGVGAGDTVIVDDVTGRVIGPQTRITRIFDIDTPCQVRVVAPLPKGGALAVDARGRRGLVSTDQRVSAGALMPVIQVNENSKGPVWAAIGSPLPA